MKQNVYLVKIISRRYTHYDLYRPGFIGNQVVFGKKQLDKIYDDKIREARKELEELKERIEDYRDVIVYSTDRTQRLGIDELLLLLAECIGDKKILYYCFPKDSGDIVAKTRLATEEIYKLHLPTKVHSA